MLICDTHADTIGARTGHWNEGRLDVTLENLTLTNDTRVQTMALFIPPDGMKQCPTIAQKQLAEFERMKLEGFHQVRNLDEAIPGRANVLLSIEGGEAFGDTVEGVDEGIYVISETTTPQGYEKIDQDITVTLSSTLASGPAGLKDLAVTVAGGERLELGSPGEDLAPTVDAERGIVSLTVTNDKLVAVPLTGLAGLQGDGLGVLAASASAVLLVARRRHMAKFAQN